MAKNKRDWPTINARKGKPYRGPSKAGEKSATYAGTQGKSRFAEGRKSGGDYEYDRQESWQSELPRGALLGRNPVIEAMRNDREIEKILVSKGAEGSIVKIIAMAKERGIPVYQSDKKVLDRIANGAPHQGVIAYASSYHYSEMEDIYAKAQAAGEPPLVIVLDNLEDPHNLGAIMRSAECAGAHGVIIPKRRSCGLTEIVAKSSAGAVEYMPCVKVANIGQTVDRLKEDGFWIAASDMDGTVYYEQDLTGKLAIVIGSEGAGISQLVKKKCDFVLSIPMMGQINSLNASNAAAVLMYEVRRQRNGK